MSGFSESLTTDVRVTQDDVTRVRTGLTVGQLTDTVTVTAGAAVLQTDRADVRTEITVASSSRTCPFPLGRNYQNLFVTIPGISPPENMHSVAVNPSRGLGFNSNGTTRNANAIRIEGAISNNLWLPHVAAYVPALDAIETVSVVTSTLRRGSEGLSGGMSANVRDQERHQRVHGSLFEYHYNEKLKARPYFLPAAEREAEDAPESVRRHARRPDRAEQAVLLRQLRGHRTTARRRSASARCRPRRCAAATSPRRRIRSTIR